MIGHGRPPKRRPPFVLHAVHKHGLAELLGSTLRRHRADRHGAEGVQHEPAKVSDALDGAHVLLNVLRARHRRPLLWGSNRSGRTRQEEVLRGAHGVNNRRLTDHTSALARLMYPRAARRVHFRRERTRKGISIFLFLFLLLMILLYGRCVVRLEHALRSAGKLRWKNGPRHVRLMTPDAVREGDIERRSQRRALDSIGAVVLFHGRPGIDSRRWNSACSRPSGAQQPIVERLLQEILLLHQQRFSDGSETGHFKKGEKMEKEKKREKWYE
jgi:hypothetical protein